MTESLDAHDPASSTLPYQLLRKIGIAIRSSIGQSSAPLEPSLTKMFPRR